MKKILIIDDDQMILEILRTYLGKKFNIISTETVGKALELISSSNDFYGLITDFNLCDPLGRNGLSLATVFKETYPESFIILSTGSFLKKEQSNLLENQLQGTLLEKPYSLVELEKLLIRYSEIQNLKRSPREVEASSRVDFALPFETSHSTSCSIF